MSQTVRVVRKLTAPADRAFEAWVDPEMVRRFLFATPDGEVIRCEVDPRIGGKLLIVDRRPDAGDVEHRGEFIELDRPKRLAFRFQVPAYDPTWTTVALDIQPRAEGCEIILTHEGVLDDWVEPTRSGWTMILDSLDRALA